jgi:hypothetical protein
MIGSPDVRRLVILEKILKIGTMTLALLVPIVRLALSRPLTRARLHRQYNLPEFDLLAKQSM